MNVVLKRVCWYGNNIAPKTSCLKVFKFLRGEKKTTFDFIKQYASLGMAQYGRISPNEYKNSPTKVILATKKEKRDFLQQKEAE